MIGASAVQCLVVASFALARKRTRLKWLAGNCLAGAGYALGCFLSASYWLPLTARWYSGVVGYSMAALYFSTVIHFLNLTFHRKPAHWERWVHALLYLMAILVWIPGVIFRWGEIRTWEFAWTTYSFPEATPFVWPAGIVMFAGVFTFCFVLFSTTTRPLQIAGLLFAACAAHDVFVCLGTLQVTWLAALGTLVFLAVLSQREARNWASEANLLTELKSDLEASVQERSAELAASRDELAKSERMASLGRLAASVGHEINNPLTYVICNLELLRIQLGENHPSVEDALEGAQRIARIVKELRILSKPSDQLNQVLVDLRGIVATARKTVQHQLTSDVQLQVNADSPYFVYGDPDRLTQLLVNLLSNAIAAVQGHGKHGVIQVGVQNRGHDVVVTVADNGCGIPEEVQSRLFEPFYSLKPEGLGLGLAISRMIVEDAHGKMSFTSEVNEGTTFEIHLPRSVDSPDEPASPVAIEEIEKPRVDGKILIVDDEPAVLASFRRMLHDYDVVVASNGAEALRVIDEEDLEFVFCDIVMPDISGIEVLKRLMRQDMTGIRRFVLMSGGDRSLTYDSEVFEGIPFLQKPFTLADIYRVLGQSQRAVIN